jgi:hypothetical protein
MDSNISDEQVRATVEALVRPTECADARTALRTTATALAVRLVHHDWDEFDWALRDFIAAMEEVRQHYRRSWRAWSGEEVPDPPCGSPADPVCAP